MEIGLIEAAKARARLDLTRIMVIQMECNSQVASVLIDLRDGKKPDRADIDQLLDLNSQIGAQLEKWLSDAEEKMGAD